jgi:hypothetical protein
LFRRREANPRRPARLPHPPYWLPALIAAVLTVGPGATSAFADPIHVLESCASPNGAWRVELADQHIPFTYELFSTDLATGLSRKIGKPTAPYEDVVPGFLISASSRRVIYTQRNSALGTDRQLYSAAIDGINWTRISPPMVPGGGVEPGFQLVWGGMYVRFLADPYVDEHYSWFVVHIAGGPVLGEIFTDDFESGATAAWS